MDVRVWGAIEDRLIEVRASMGGAFRIEGLPEARAHTAGDRVRAALINSGLVREAPAVVLRLEPGARAGCPSFDLDLPLALAALGVMGMLGVGLRWVFAVGRLGLDGTVHARGAVESALLGDVVGSLCRTRVLDSEHMFENEGS